MVQSDMISKSKRDKRGYGWMGGICAGVFLSKIPVLGVAVGAFSLFMLLSSIRSDEYKAKKLYAKGLAQFEKGYYSYSYILFKKAYEYDSENPDIMRMLVLANLENNKDLVEARILIDEMSMKWTSHINLKEIEDMRDQLSLKAVL